MHTSGKRVKLSNLTVAAQDPWSTSSHVKSRSHHMNSLTRQLPCHAPKTDERFFEILDRRARCESRLRLGAS
jgi:hypothetical protein